MVKIQNIIDQDLEIGMIQDLEIGMIQDLEIGMIQDLEIEGITLVPLLELDLLLDLVLNQDLHLVLFHLDLDQGIDPGTLKIMILTNTGKRNPILGIIKILGVGDQRMIDLRAHIIIQNILVEKRLKTLGLA
jgi:hypothetical protein